MDYKTLLALAAGLLAVAAFAVVFRNRFRGLGRVLINSLAGAVLLIMLGFFGTAVLPLNPLNALLVGILGVPGLIGIFLITYFF